MRHIGVRGRIGFVIVTAALAHACGPDPAPGYRPAATVEDIMRVFIDPSADAIWDAVVIDATAEGIVEIRPDTTDDWAMLRSHALTIAEASNLLKVEGRRIAAPGSRSELPGVDLDPGAIEELVADDRESWVDLAHGLYKTSATVLSAIDARDLDALLSTGADLYAACENCHSRYWYPDDAEPRPTNAGRE